MVAVGSARRNRGLGSRGAWPGRGGTGSRTGSAGPGPCNSTRPSRPSCPAVAAPPWPPPPRPPALPGPAPPRGPPGPPTPAPPRAPPSPPPYLVDRGARVGTRPYGRHRLAAVPTGEQRAQQPQAAAREPRGAQQHGQAGPGRAERAESSERSRGGRPRLPPPPPLPPAQPMGTAGPGPAAEPLPGLPEELCWDAPLFTEDYVLVQARKALAVLRNLSYSNRDRPF